MRLEIRYANRFSYPEPVRDSHNVLRACPATEPGQRLIDYRLSIDPAARILTYTDYWGTRVDAFGVRQPHDHLLIVAEAVVETSERAVPGPGSARLDAYAGDDIRFGLPEYLRRTRHTRWDHTVDDAARDLTAGASDPVELITRIDRGIHEMLRYRPGTTTVGIDVNEILSRREGVCQDYTHLALAMYRSLGVPARYVSGYVYAATQDGGAVPEAEEVEIQTHAWVEAFVPGFGWWGRDPTNAETVGPRHVKIGHGRDYDDVLPLRGVYHGPTDHQLGVSVRISREVLSRLQEQQIQQ